MDASRIEIKTINFHRKLAWPSLQILAKSAKINFVKKIKKCDSRTLKGETMKRCSENMHQVYTPMPKCDFNKVAKQLY